MYAGNYFIADQNRGEGDDNNLLLTNLMEGVAKGETSWDALIGDAPVREGIVKPNDPSFLIVEYIQRVTADKETYIAKR
jgi:hypothetical protein